MALSAVAALVLSAAASAGTLVIGNKGEDTVSFVDLGSGEERVRLETGRAPHEVAISPDYRFAAVVSYGAASVDIFDVRDAKRVRTIDISPNAAPHGAVWAAKNRLVLVAEKSQSLVIVNPSTGSFRSVNLGQKGVHMLVVGPMGRRAYTANVGAGTISVVDLVRGKKLSDIAVGGMPEGLAITRDGTQLWVGDNSAPRLRVVDVATGMVVDTLPTDPVPIRVAISPDGKTAITSNIGVGTLSVFDVATRKPLRTITVSGARDAIQVTAVFSRDGKSVYVAETGRNTIAEVDLATGKVLRRIAAGKGADGLAIAP
ncbi:hypothetical protein GCM10011494_19370 [Novosphingobium endophyticum]|uniref:YncE family protein n=2 Tax=Novosphingobium endophyticum TaxID=1955250 RepID=A0A916TSH6_9SPHN|nr:hypothetical protein GCM10011494_19370 [Novosphingobium endophyticum]